MTPDKTSVEAYRSLRARFSHATLAPVHNEMLGPAQHRDKYPLASGSPVVRIPVLAPGLRRYIETPPFSFADAQLAETAGIPVSAHVEIQHRQALAFGVACFLHQILGPSQIVIIFDRGFFRTVLKTWRTGRGGPSTRTSRSGRAAAVAWPARAASRRAASQKIQRTGPLGRTAQQHSCSARNPATRID